MSLIFTHAEADLAAELGLPPKKIARVRADSLAVGTDWKHLRGEVRYSAAGRVALFALLGVPLHAAPAEHLAPKKIGEVPDGHAPGEPPAVNAPPDLAPAPVRPAGAPERGEVRELEVVRTYHTNQRIVLAREGGREARVRVKDSGNLVAGMTMRCAYVQADLWELAQRLPRWRGKW